MKKFTLSVTSPCHEKWEQMTPDQHGRFCASCQKTVVDFTAMSDRQIVEYFKKSAASTCGRFYSDQLNREVVAPQKGLPWLRYFFQFTWPAFILFLKSCGQKEKLTGDYVMEEKIDEREFLTMGFALPQITPVDTSKPSNEKMEKVSCSTVVGDVEIAPEKEVNCSAVQIDASETEPAKQEISDKNITLGDTTIVSTEFPDSLRNVVLGGFSVVRTSVIRHNEVPLLSSPIANEEQVSLQAVVFPNPVHNGQSLTLVSKQKMNGRYQIVNMAGQLMKSGQLVLMEQQSFSIPIQNWPPGTYIIQMMDGDGAKRFTQKIIVQ